MVATMTHSQPAADTIARMDYNQLIGVVRETNRPPGGEHAIYRLAQQAFLGSHSRVLEIGTSTGVTAIELARLAGCHVVAIDINEMSLQVARQRAEAAGVKDLIEFRREDASRTSFGDGSFDFVFCGNVTSLIDQRDAALREYCRVLRVGGFLGAIPMYYVATPSDELVARVCAAIKVAITPRDRRYWMGFFAAPPLAMFWNEDYRFDRISDEKLLAFVTQILCRPHLRDLDPDAASTLQTKYSEYMWLFRDNLALMGFTLMLLRKEDEAVDPELFTSYKL